MQSITCFVRLLADIAAGTVSAAEWSQLVVTHYHDPRIETARVALARASIAAGQWRWDDVPQSVRTVAAQLFEQLRQDYRA